MRLFKKIRSVRRPYKEQGLICFVCLNVKKLPEEVQRKILNLCIEVAGEDYKALYDFLTDDSLNAVGVCRKHLIDEKKLYKLRKEFYEKW